MLAKITEFVKTHTTEIILVIIVMLLIMASFASGFIIAKYQQKTPIQIQQTTN